MTEVTIALTIQVDDEDRLKCGKCPNYAEKRYCAIPQFDEDIINGYRCQVCLDAERALRRMLIMSGIEGRNKS